MELVIAVAFFGTGLAIFAGHGTIIKTASGLLRLTPSWFKRAIFGDHVMWFAVGFFAITLVTLTKVFGP